MLKDAEFMVATLARESIAVQVIATELEDAQDAFTLTQASTAGERPIEGMPVAARASRARDEHRESAAGRQLLSGHGSQNDGGRDND